MNDKIGTCAWCGEEINTNETRYESVVHNFREKGMKTCRESLLEFLNATPNEQMTPKKIGVIK